MSVQLISTQSAPMMPHCALYGPSGSQKTRMIPTLPNPVICSTDEGLSSIREFNLPFHRCNNYQDFVGFRDWVKQGGAGQFQTIVYDDVTEACALYLKMAFDAGSKSGNKADGRKVYGEMADEFLAFFREMRALTTHTVVLIFKEERIEDENHRLIYSPLLPGKALQGMVTYLFSQVYRMESARDHASGQQYPIIRTRRNEVCEAKDRSGKLDELEQAHLGNICAKVMS